MVRLFRSATTASKIPRESCSRKNSTGPSLLNELTELTGGRAFTVENLNDLPDIAAKIDMELRNNIFWDTAQATKRMTHAGGRSRSSCAPRDFLLSLLTQRQAITRPAARFGEAVVALLVRRPAATEFRIESTSNISEPLPGS